MCLFGSNKKRNKKEAKQKTPRRMQTDSKENAGMLEEYSKLCDMKAMPVLFYSHTSGEFACFFKL